MGKTCTTPGCTGQHRARGLCKTCYGRMRRAQIAEGLPIKRNLRAKPPEVPHANLSITGRDGQDKNGSITWHVACTCGHTFSAPAPRIKDGSAKCPTCQPSIAAIQSAKVLALLPATYEAIMFGTGMTRPMTKHRIDMMRRDDLCHIGAWARADSNGNRSPIFHAGPGEDARCQIPKLTGKDYSSRYRKKIKGTEKEDRRKARVNARYWVERAAKVGDPLVLAICRRPSANGDREAA